MTQLLPFIILTVSSYLGVSLIRRYAETRHIVDRPNERSSHTAPTPRGRGVAIVILVLGIGLWSASDAELSRGLIYIGCAALIAWRDDLHSLSPRLQTPAPVTKLLVSDT